MNLDTLITELDQINAHHRAKIRLLLEYHKQGLINLGAVLDDIRNEAQSKIINSCDSRYSLQQLAILIGIDRIGEHIVEIRKHEE